MVRFDKRDGFTLIELIIVIVILGVLSAVVLPRFVDLERQARVAVIEQVAGAMRSTSALFHAQALVEGVGSDELSVDGQTIQMRSAYIMGHWNWAWTYVLDIGKTIEYTPADDICVKNDLCGVGNQFPVNRVTGLRSTARGLVMIWPLGLKLEDDCFAYYYNPDDGEPPQIGTVTDGC